MSNELQDKRIRRELALRAVSLVEPPPSIIRQLSDSMTDSHFRKNDTILERGGASDWIYFVISGESILRAPGEPDWHFSGGGVLGALDALSGRPYSRTAVAKTDVDTIGIFADDYFDIMEDNIKYSHSIITEIAVNLHEGGLSLPDPTPFFQRDGRRELLRSDARKLTLVEKLLVLRQMRAFSRSTVQSLVALAECAEVVELPQGMTLFQERDESEIFWLIARGAMRIRSDKPAVDALRGPGELIENYAAFGSAERRFTADAETPVTMLRIPKDDVFDRMEEHFELTRSVLAFLADERMRLNSAEAEARTTGARAPESVRDQPTLATRLTG